MSEKKINTKKYGQVIVRNAMLDIDGTNLSEGIEIKGDFDLIEVFEFYDINEITNDQVEELIDKHK